MKKKTHEQFVQELKIVQPNLVVLNKYEKSNVHLIIKDEYDIIYKVLPLDLLNKRKPSIKSSLDPSLAFKIKLKLVQPKLIVLSDYIGYNKEIIVQDIDGIKYTSCPESLLQGHLPTINSALNKNEIIINRFNKIHNNKYDYSLVYYNNNRSKIEILCKQHGSFFQRVSRHISGDGCPICCNENHKGAIINTFRNDPASKIFIYLFRCFNDEEEFYKVGLSKNPKERSYQIPYNIEILVTAFDSVELLYPLEQLYHKQFKDTNKNYKPKLMFSGWTECFK